MQYVGVCEYYHDIVWRELLPQRVTLICQGRSRSCAGLGVLGSGNIWNNQRVSHY